MEVAILRSFHFPFINLYIYAAFQTENRKWKPRQFSLTSLLFALHVNWSFICPFVDEETNGSYLFANGLNRQNEPDRLAHLQYGWRGEQQEAEYQRLGQNIRKVGSIQLNSECGRNGIMFERLLDFNPYRTGSEVWGQKISPTLTSNYRKTWKVFYLYKNIHIPAEMYCEPFLLHTQHKK